MKKSTCVGCWSESLLILTLRKKSVRGSYGYRCASLSKRIVRCTFLKAGFALSTRHGTMPCRLAFGCLMSIIVVSHFICTLLGNEINYSAHPGFVGPGTFLAWVVACVEVHWDEWAVATSTFLSQNPWGATSRLVMGKEIIKRIFGE